MTQHPHRRVEHGVFTQHAVVVAVDCGQASLRAVDFAAGHARRNAVDLVGVYVRRSTGLALCVPGLTAYVSATEDEIAVEVEQYLAESCRQVGRAYGFTVLTGQPGRQVRRLAAQLRASALVVGVSGRGGGRGYGSLAARLARTADCPVIVIP